MSQHAPHVLIVGCGYVGQRLARRLMETYRRLCDRSLRGEGRDARELGHPRDRARSGSRARLGAQIPERLDRRPSSTWRRRPHQGESDLRLDRFLQLATVPPASFVYMSTTGVYGDTEGALGR